MNKKLLLLIPALVLLVGCGGKPHEHTFSTSWSHNDDYHYHVCSGCSEHDEDVPHSFGSGTVIKQKTCTEDGEKLFICSACGHEHHEIIPKGHTFSDQLSFNDTEHWYAATCEHTDQKKDVAPHELYTDGIYQKCRKCGYKKTTISKLDAPTNLSFDQSSNLFSFDEVEYALAYEIVIFDQDSKEVERFTITDTYTTLDFSYGYYTVGVTAKNGDVASDQSTLPIKILKVDTNVRHEAEDCLVTTSDWDFISPGCYINESRASNGQIIGNIWTGVTFHVSYYALTEGARYIDICYVNGSSNQQMSYGLNGAAQVEVDIPAQVPGSWDWANNSVISIEVNLLKGWNDITFGCLGGHAQYDYFEVRGTQSKYDPDDYNYERASGSVYAIECNKYPNTSTNHANNWGNPFFAYGGMGLGDDISNGFTTSFRNLKKGSYTLSIEYGVKDDNVSMLVKINDGDFVTVSLPNTGEWYILGEVTLNFELTDVNYLFIKIAQNGHWANINRLSFALTA